jgi:hypothetical protein
MALAELANTLPPHRAAFPQIKGMGTSGLDDDKVTEALIALDEDEAAHNHPISQSHTP